MTDYDTGEEFEPVPTSQADRMPIGTRVRLQGWRTVPDGTLGTIVAVHEPTSPENYDFPYSVRVDGFGEKPFAASVDLIKATEVQS